MAKDPTSQPKTRRKAAPAPEQPVPAEKRALWPRLRFVARRAALGVLGGFGAMILAFSFLPPPINIYQASEAWRHGGISKDWVGWDDIAPVMARSVVAAEDANFCLHWGFDVAAIKDAISEGSQRGASTLSQQVVKNVFLWHGRSYLRKALEAVLTPVVELVWSKQRILEVYMNVAEFGTGIFGVQAAAQHYFGVDAAKLSPTQAARLAAILPDPKGRDPNGKTRFMQRRSAAIVSGAETILADGRAACFEW